MNSNFPRTGVTIYTPGGGGSTPPSPGVSQTGRVAIVAGTQSYNISFAAGFSAAPTYFGASIMMVNSFGETFDVVADLSTLTTTGVTVWLSGVPTSASTGAYISWSAAA